jgi:hypothetical protein
MTENDGCQGTRNNSRMGKAGPEGVLLFEGTATTRAIPSEFPSQRLTKREVLAKQSIKILHIKDWNS